MKPYLVLGTLEPGSAEWPGWRARSIGLGLCMLTRRLGLIPHYDPAHGPLQLSGKNWSSVGLHAEVRRRTFKKKEAEDWHFDSDLEPNGNPHCAIVLWCSNNATEIKWRFKNYDPEFDVIWQPEPYEIVMFHNEHCLHRRPAGVPRVRWVFRQRVQIPTHMKLP